MTTTLVLAKIKSYLRVDHTDDDTLITDLATAAEAHIRSLCVPFLDAEDDSWDTLPEVLQMAVKVLVAHWYDTRAAVSDKAMKDIPWTIAALIANYRDPEEEVEDA